MNWQRLASGTYGCAGGAIDAVIVLDGELWRNYVYYDGNLIDQGEWDNRGAAFRNARRAMKMAVKLRDPLRLLNAGDEEADELDD